MVSSLGIRRQPCSTLAAPELIARRAAKAAIETILGITLDPSQLSLNRGTLMVEVSPMVRSELYLKRGMILATIAHTPGAAGAVRDIR